MSIITLTTDFGIKDFNVSIFKGLLNIELDNPKIIDISHEISPFNIIEGAYVIKNAYRNFPRGSIHIVDIDCQVTVFGLTAKTNDIIHADQHGAVLIPPAAVKQRPAVVDLISRREAIILEATKSTDFTVAKLKTSMGQIKDIH